MGTSLSLREKLKQTHLIQRLHPPSQFNNPFSFGGGLRNGGLSDEAMELLRNVFSFDYMGAAEFEFGAVPEALNFLARQSIAGNLDATTFHIKENITVYIIAPKPYMKEVIGIVHDLYDDEAKFRLHERCGLRSFFHGTDYGTKKGTPQEWHLKNQGWLEIDNGFMFFTNKEMFEKTCALFGIENKKAIQCPSPK